MSHSAESQGFPKDPLDSESGAARSETFQASDVDWVWDQFAELLGMSEVLASEASTPEQFYDRVLNELVSGFAADGGRVWILDSKSPKLLCQHGPDLSQADRSAHEQVLAHAIDCFEAITESVGSRKLSVVAVPATNEQKTSAALIEITQRSDAPREVYETTARLLEAVASNATLLHMRIASEFLHNQIKNQSELLGLAQRVAGDMRIGPTAYRIVNECQQVLEMDRVSIFDVRGHVPRLLATSQVEKLDRRSKTVLQLKEFVKLAAHEKHALCWSADSQIDQEVSFPEEYQDKVDIYSDENHVRNMMLAPMFAPNEVHTDTIEETQQKKLLGILVGECFQNTETTEQLTAFTKAAQVCAPALDAAIKTPLASLQRSLSWWVKPSRLLLTSLIFLLLSVGLIAACFIQIEHTVTLRGQVVPVRQYELYAPADSQVMQIRIESGQSVTAGETLIELQDMRSLLELQRLQGELALYSRQLDSVTASRLSLDRSTTNTEEKLRLTAEQERLRLEVESTQKMIELIENERDLLMVRSPINGIVSTWQVDQLLENRPVERGQQLLSVVDRNAGWKIELEAPDDRLGILRNAKQSKNEELVVEYQLASAQEDIYLGKVSQISPMVEQPEDELGRPFARVEVETNDLAEMVSDKETPLFGVSVTAEVQCGKKNIAEVAVYDVWRFLKMKWELGW